MTVHKPVLLQEVIRYADPKPGDHFIDCTLGGAGHTIELASSIGPKGKILAIDWDPYAAKEAMGRIRSAKLQDRVNVVQGNFAQLEKIAQREKFSRVKGILLDLGFSSDQLELGRGFSFQKDEPLDMRYDPAHPLTASTIVNYWSRQDIERILKEYGEERFAKDIAQALLNARITRNISKTSQLVRVLEQVLPRGYIRGKIHFATRTFQALRIAVNGELDNLKAVLPQATRLLLPGGKLLVTSFHSLEDRIVKEFFKKESSLHMLTKKPVSAGPEELGTNKRARSAKLRVAQKI